MLFSKAVYGDDDNGDNDNNAAVAAWLSAASNDG